MTVSGSADDPGEEAGGGLTPEEAELLVQLLRDPEARQRLSRVIQETYLNPEWWQAGVEAVRRVYFDADRWKRMAADFQAVFLDPEMWRRLRVDMSETLLNPDTWRAAVEAVERSYPRESFAGLGGAISDVYELHGVDPRVVQTARDFAREVEQSEDEGPTPEGPAPLGWWLSTRTGRTQALLLVQALAVLHAFNEFVAKTTDKGAPEAVLAATSIVVAFATFLLVWMDNGWRGDE